MSKRLSLIETMAEYEKVAGDNAERSRGRFKENKTLRNAENKGYYEGIAAGYSTMRALTQAELRRLMNRFQNGSLSIEDFGVDP